MANNDNVVIIGTALKWRGVFDLKKKYYNENIVSACGCVFRCKILQAQNLSPIEFEEETGHLVYINPDVWDVIVDNAYYFNFAVDTKTLTEETLSYVKELDEQIKLVKEDNEKQWNKIHKLRRSLGKTFKRLISLESGFDSNLESLQSQITDLNRGQISQDEILARHTTILEQLLGNYEISVVNYGIWDNTLLWGNDDFWQNTFMVQSSSCGCTEHNQEVDKKIESLENEIQKLKELIKNGTSGNITIEDYDDETKKIKLGGPIYYVDYDPKTQTGEVTAPYSDVSHNSEENAVKLS